MERHLAAVLAADVVSYSSAMEADEEGTLARLKALREEVFDPEVAGHRGRIVKTTGDGALVEFPSSVDALRCAVRLQRELQVRNEQAPEAERLQLRIGINVGDVMLDEDDIYGTGVNVAARLESLAEPGGICVSARVLDQAEGNLDVGFAYLGAQKVKNIERAVEAYKVLLGEEHSGKIVGAPAGPPGRGGRRAVAAAGALALLLAAALGGWFYLGQPGLAPPDAQQPPSQPAERPSIAVLPFTNISEDPEQEYFADGMTEDVITDLSRIPEVTVISRSSTAGYKGRQFDIREVGKLLGVRYLLEGSVRKAGEQIRINVQLVDATTGGQIWAERYDGSQTDIFTLQDQVLEKVVRSLAIKLSEEARVRLASRGTTSVAAHDLYLRGLFLESTFTRESNSKAVEYYEQALSVDPDYALPYARISNILQLNARNGWSDDIDADLERAVQLAEKAVALDPKNPLLHWSLGRSIARLRTPEMLERGITALQRAIELDPDYADAYAYLGVLYLASGRAEDALRSVETGMRLNPRYPFWYLHMRGMAHYVTENYELAIADLEEAASQSPTAQFVRFWLAASYAQAGRIEDAEWEVDELRIMGFDGSVSTIVETGNLQYPEYVARIEEGLRKAGFPD